MKISGKIVLEENCGEADDPKQRHVRLEKQSNHSFFNYFITFLNEWKERGDVY